MKIERTLDSVYTALVAGLNGAKLSGGETLTCTGEPADGQYDSAGILPHLEFSTGAHTAEQWDTDTSKIIWDIKAKLKVSGEAGKTNRPIQTVISDLYHAVALIRGLPVHSETGELLHYGDKLIKLVQQKKTVDLADRGGPFVKSATAKEPGPEDPYPTADMVFHLEFLMNQPVEVASKKVTFVSLGVNVLDPLRQALNWNPATQEYSLPRPSAADTVGWTMFQKPDTTLTHNGELLYANNPPVPPDVHSIEGGDPSQTVVKLEIIPNYKTLAALATQQLLVIATYRDGGTANVTGAISWTSGTSAAATISGTGLVTAVSTGTSSITAAMNGIAANNSCLITVS